jgi:CDP-diacylglycerol--serine O-phosphatidyltransferase
MNEPTPETRRPRGVYLLPNLFTTAALFCGFYAIIAALHGRFEPAASRGIYRDGAGWTGRPGAARLTHTESEFGAQYDSMADLVSFGLAPALIMYEWALGTMITMGPFLSKLGWLAAFFYTVMAALRLARFNVQSGSTDKRYFIGLPSPSAAAIVTGLVWFGTDLGLTGIQLLWPALIITVSAGALMFSKILYFSLQTGRSARPGTVHGRIAGGTDAGRDLHRSAQGSVHRLSTLCAIWANPFLGRLRQRARRRNQPPAEPPTQK